MRKQLFTIVLAVLAVSLLVFAIGCSDKSAASSEPATSGEPAASSDSYADGIYFAQEEGFADTGWKYTVTIEVKDGKIVSADWNGANKMGGATKKTVSKAGEYGMAEKGGAISEWHVQAEATEKWLLKSQNPKAMNITDADGHTDSIAGVTIKAETFAKLAEKALSNGVVGYGEYKDGAYRAEEAEFPSTGWKSTADFTVISGYVVAAWWDGLDKDGRTKKAVSEAGDYGMVANGGAIAEWHVQAEAVEDYFIATQGVAPKMDSEGATDAISGATVHVSDFYALAEKALPKR